MNDKLMECLIHPVKNRIYIEIYGKEQATAKDLVAKCPDIPQATLYRHLKSMVADGLLNIVEKRQVRNVTEKVYAVSFHLEEHIQKRLFEENDGQAYFMLFQQFTLGLLKQFKAYAQQENINILADGSGFRVAPIYSTFEELEELSKQMWALVVPYREKASNQQKLRSLAVITTPPVEE